MKIIIDRETIFSLSSSPRIDILKLLSIQRRTLGELTKITSSSRANIYYHLQKLIDSGLVKTVETGNVWIYYQLTDKGKHLIQPNDDDQIVLMITTGLILYSIGVILIVNVFSLPRLPAISIFPILNTFLYLELIIGLLFAAIGTTIIIKKVHWIIKNYSFH